MKISGSTETLPLSLLTEQQTQPKETITFPNEGVVCGQAVRAGDEIRTVEFDEKGVVTKVKVDPKENSMTTTAQWLDLKIQVEKDSHDEQQEKDAEYVAEIYDDYKNLLAIRAQLQAAAAMAKALDRFKQAILIEYGSQQVWDVNFGYCDKALSAWVEAGGEV